VEIASTIIYRLIFGSSRRSRLLSEPIRRIVNSVLAFNLRICFADSFVRTGNTVRQGIMEYCVRACMRSAYTSDSFKLSNYPPAGFLDGYRYRQGKSDTPLQSDSRDVVGLIPFAQRPVSFERKGEM